MLGFLLGTSDLDVYILRLVTNQYFPNELKSTSVESSSIQVYLHFMVTQFSISFGPPQCYQFLVIVTSKLRLI